MQLAGFLDDVCAWTQSRPDVLGLAMVGSQARGEARTDSDVDLVMLCRNPAELAACNDWIARFGEVRDTVREVYGVLRAVRVFYRHGLEVEFGLCELEWADVPLDAGTKRVISDGMRILYDPAGLLRRARNAASA